VAKGVSLLLFVHFLRYPDEMMKMPAHEVGKTKENILIRWLCSESNDFGGAAERSKPHSFDMIIKIKYMIV
jgi:hypothetical protein